jgi:hypothetical protein
MKVEGRFSAFPGNQQDKHSIIKHPTFDSAKKFCELAWHLKVKKCHILEQVKSRDKKKFATHLLRISLSFFLFFWLQAEMFTVKIVFSGEVNFRMSGRVNRHNVRKGEQQSVCSDKLQRAIPCALSKQKFLGSIFFCRASIRVCGAGVVSSVY